MTDKTYLLQDARELNLQFYRGFDEQFLFRKAETLKRLVDDVEKYKSTFLDGDSDDFDQVKFIETLNAEIHFTEFHQFEAFFAILIADFQELPHWLYLTTYTIGDIKQKIHSLLKRDLTSVSNGMVHNLNDFINRAVYSGFVINDEKVDNKWQNNLDNLFTFITRIANKYINGSEYNAYKHGLRVITGPTYIKFSPTGQPGKGFQYASDNSIRFLELDQVEKNKFNIKETFKHFNPVESINHLYFMSSILETIKSTRMARFIGDTEAKIHFFPTIDEDNLNRIKVRTKWSITL